MVHELDRARSAAQNPTELEYLWETDEDGALLAFKRSEYPEMALGDSPDVSAFKWNDADEDSGSGTLFDAVTTSV